MRCTHLLLALFVVTVSLATPDELVSAQARYVLTSVEQNIDVGNWQIGGRETAVAPGVSWSVRRQRLHGGKQDGVDLIVIDNGRISRSCRPEAWGSCKSSRAT